jgi:hypothetical protein
MSAAPWSGRPSMSLDEIDGALARFDPAYDRVAAALYAMDTHPAMEFLRTTPTTGQTQAAWRDAQLRADALWAAFDALRGRLDTARALRARLDTARALRGRRNRPAAAELDELTGVLRDPAPDPGVGLGGLGGPAGPGGGQTLEELAREVETGCADLTGLLDLVAEAGSVLATAAAPAVDALAEVDRLAAELGVTDPVPADVRGGLAAIADRVVTDPLSAAGGGAAFAGGTGRGRGGRGRDGRPAARGPVEIDGALAARLRGLTARISAIAVRLAEVARFRTELPERLRALSNAVDDLAAAEAGTARAYETALVKIAQPGLPEPPAAAGRLAARLRAVGRAPGGDWFRLADEVADLDRAVAEARQWAGRLTEAAQGLLERRTELRGRLAAYAAKAASLGYAEHPGLHAHQVRARDLLYTSPCDLAASTRAVVAYQETLAALGEPAR